MNKAGRLCQNVIVYFSAAKNLFVFLNGISNARRVEVIGPFSYTERMSRYEHKFSTFGRIIFFCKSRRAVRMSKKFAVIRI